MPKLINLVGKQFGYWKVLGLNGSAPGRDHLWACQCVCGVSRPVSGRNLRNGGSLGCGCTKPGLRKAPFRALYNSLLAANKHRHYVGLTFTEFKRYTSIHECHYCGAPLEWAKFHLVKNGSNYNLDRKDNRLGYTAQNCVVCCGTCNRVKSDVFTYEQFLVIGDLIRSWRK